MKEEYGYNDDDDDTGFPSFDHYITRHEFREYKGHITITQAQCQKMLFSAIDNQAEVFQTKLDSFYKSVRIAGILVSIVVAVLTVVNVYVSIFT